MENKHITKEVLYEYHNNLLSDEESYTFLEHISQCTYCADLFAGSFRDEMLIAAPKNLKELILIEAKQTKAAPVKKQLFLYNLRVCAAVFGALIILFTGFNDSAPNDFSVKVPSVSFHFLESINSSIQDITYQINERTNQFITNKNYNNGGNLHDSTER